MEVQQRGGWKSHESVERYEKHVVLTKEMSKFDPLLLRRANHAARYLLDNYERIFAPFYGSSLRNPEWCWTSSQAAVASARPCELEDTQAWPSTSSTGRTTTSRTLRSVEY